MGPSQLDLDRLALDQRRASIEKQRVEIENQRLALERQRIDLEFQRLQLEHHRSTVLEQDKLEGEMRKVSFESVMKFAELSVKSLLILNGGAALAILTFSANTGKIGAGIPSNDLAFIVWWFGAGAFLSVATAALSYFAQVAYTELPSDRGINVGNGLRALAVSAGISSLFLFGCGVNSAAKRLSASAAAGPPPAQSPPIVVRALD